MDEVASFARQRQGQAQDQGREPPLLLDLRGLKCPLPVLHTRRALRRLSAGQGLRVLCTDPLAAIDIPNLAREDGHVLVETSFADGMSAFVVIKQSG